MALLASDKMIISGAVVRDYQPQRRSVAEALSSSLLLLLSFLLLLVIYSKNIRVPYINKTLSTP